MGDHDLSDGKVWREKAGKQRVGRVRYVTMSIEGGGQGVRLDITAPNKPGVRSWTEMKVDALRAKWELIS